MKQKQNGKERIFMKKINDEEEVRLKMLMLRSRYTYYKFMYYERSQQVISDWDFDQLEKDFEDICELIERVYPKIFEIYKPRTWVGVHHTPYGYPKEKINESEKVKA